MKGSRCVFLSVSILAMLLCSTSDGLDARRVAVGSYPDVVVDAGGLVHIVYVRGEQVIVRSRSADGGWGAEREVPVPATVVERSDPELAVDTAGRLHVFCGAVYAREEEKVWTTVEVPKAARDTAMAVDAAGDAYICFRGGWDGGDLGMIKIRAGSRAFEKLPDPDIFGGRGKGMSNHVYGHVFAGTKPGEIHVVYRHHEPPLRCGYRYTSDGGKTWNGGGIADDDFEAPSGVTAPDGTPYVITGKGEVFRRGATAETWTSLGRAVPAGRRDLPAIAVDGTGTVYAACFGGNYNIHRDGTWRWTGRLPASRGMEVGFVEIAANTGVGAWIVWEDGPQVSNELRAGAADIWVAQLVSDTASPDVIPQTPEAAAGRWDRFEMALENARTYNDPYRDVTLEVRFTRPDGRTVEFWGFYDGGTTWKFRCMPDQLGDWQYVATFSDGAPGVTGRFTCVPSELPGVLGPDLENPIWFGYSSGKHELVRSLHVGDRFFAANWPEEKRDVFLDWAVGQGYNMLSIASHYLNRKSAGRGEGWDTPALWPLDAAEYRELEVHLDDLAARRLMVFPFAGFFGRSSNYPKYPADQELYLRYTLARLGAYWNLLLNVAGPEPRLKGSPYLSVAEIHALGERIRTLDVLGHALSVHNPTGDDMFRDAPWLSYGTLQGPKTIDRKELAEGLLRNHHHAKPLYAQETLWSGNTFHLKRIGGDYSDTDLRKNAIVMHMCAAAINFGDMDGDSSSGFSGTLEIDAKKQARHDIVARVWDFFEGIPLHRLSPRPDLVSAGYCLADPQRQYLVYLEEGGDVDVAVEDGPYLVQWINAQDTADRRNAGTTEDGKGLAAPEEGEDWFLRLRKPTARLSVNSDNTGMLLDGQPFLAKGLRVSNALMSREETSELISVLDEYTDHGLNMISVFFQGSRFGDVRGYREDGTLDPVYAARMGSIIEAAAERGMAVVVGCLYYSTSRAKWPDWTQNDAERAIADTVAWLKENGYRNVLVDVNNEQMADFDDAALIAAGKTVDPECVIGTSGKETPDIADLSLHHGSPDIPGKYYIQTEGTLPGPFGYWGDYSKKPGYYNYINIGVYSDEMKQAAKEYTDSFLKRGQGFLFASTWLQCPPPHGPNHDPGGDGSVEDPGVRWWMEHIRDNWSGR